MTDGTITTIAEHPPESGNAPKQLVIFMHGVGADGNDLISLAPHFARILPNAHFLSPDAPFACDMAPFGRQWFSLLNRDPEILYTEAEKSRPIVNSFIDNQLSRFDLSDQDLILVGFSQGTMTSLHCALHRPNPCKAILGYSGALLSSGMKEEEITAKPPICLIHGDMDGVVPFAAMAHAATILEDLGLTVETHQRPGLGHGIDPEGIGLGISFLENI